MPHQMPEANCVYTQFSTVGSNEHHRLNYQLAEPRQRTAGLSALNAGQVAQAEELKDNVVQSPQTEQTTHVQQIHDKPVKVITEGDLSEQLSEQLSRLITKQRGHFIH